jgi:hypothetical protein
LAALRDLETMESAWLLGSAWSSAAPVIKFSAPAGPTPLDKHASRYGDTAALTRLLNRGCPVDASDYDGRSLLHVAVHNKQEVRVPSVSCIFLALCWCMF